jgi:hypothetical protein
MSALLEQRLFAGREVEGLVRWLPVALGLAVMYVRFGLSGRVPDGMLVRVSSISSNPAQAFNGQEEFISALLEGMRRGDVHRLLGSAEHCPWAKSCSG